MKVAPLITVALVLCIAFSYPTQAQKKPKPTFCIGLNGNQYKVGNGYVVREGKRCIRYKCVKNNNKLFMKEKKCNDGKWSDWSSWSTCTATCGDATRTRQRKCNNPPPSKWGNQCSGNDTETVECTLPSCDCGCGIPEMRKEIAALQVLIDALQTTSNKNEMDIKTITNAIETNKEGIASNEDAITVNKNYISSTKDDLATQEDAIRLNNETCTDARTTAEHLGTCLADVNSPDCPPSGIGKTSIAEAIMENKEDIDGCCGGQILNPVVLLTGGHGPNNSVEVFSIGKNWHCSKNLEDLPDSRYDHTIHFFNGKIILCGGQGNGKSCLFLNENQTFVHHSQLKDYRSYHVGAVVNDKILISGGFGNPLQMQFWNGLEWEYSEKFNELAEFEMNSCMAAISEDTILMAGGSFDRGSKFTNKMLKYKDGMWERMEDYPGNAIRGHGCAFIRTPEGDAFLMAGGGYRETSYLYNIEKRTWEEVGKMAFGRLGGKILNVGGRIIMVGGSYGPREVEEYDVYTKTWSTIPEKIKEIRGQFDAVVVPGALVGC